MEGMGKSVLSKLAPSRSVSHWVLIGVGGNLGDSDRNFARASGLLAPYVTGFRSSTHYRSKAHYDGLNLQNDAGDVPEFTNAVWSAYTDLSPIAILHRLLSIEAELGRFRSASMTISRILDLDLLLYDDCVMDTLELTLPHPRMHKRQFVLLPACELAADFVHPILNKRLSELLSMCTEGLCSAKF